jgi:hypothetical protein
MRVATLIIAIALLDPATVSATCYSVLNPQGRLVHRSKVPPIDLSQPISQEMSRQLPGYHLTITDDAGCTVFTEGNLPYKTSAAPKTTTLTATKSTRTPAKDVKVRRDARPATGSRGR